MNLMNKKRSLLMGFFMISIALLVLIVPTVQAREYNPNEGWDPTAPDLEAKEKAKSYNPIEYQTSWGISPDVLIDCDPNGDLLTQVNPGSVQGFHKLQSSACQAQATVEAAAVSSANAAGAGSCGFNGVGGETRMLKISGGFSNVRYVYLQCGKKVGVLEPPTCSCGGNWRYTYDCKKPPTVFITIPCR